MWLQQAVWVIHKLKEIFPTWRVSNRGIIPKWPIAQWIYPQPGKCRFRSLLCLIQSMQLNPGLLSPMCPDHGAIHHSRSLLSHWFWPWIWVSFIKNEAFGAQQINILWRKTVLLKNLQSAQIRTILLVIHFFTFWLKKMFLALILVGKTLKMWTKCNQYSSACLRLQFEMQESLGRAGRIIGVGPGRFHGKIPEKVGGRGNHFCQNVPQKNVEFLVKTWKTKYFNSEMPWWCLMGVVVWVFHASVLYGSN